MPTFGWWLLELNVPPLALTCWAVGQGVVRAEPQERSGWAAVLAGCQAEELQEKPPAQVQPLEEAEQEKVPAPEAETIPTQWRHRQPA